MHESDDTPDTGLPPPISPHTRAAHWDKIPAVVRQNASRTEY